MKTKFVPAPQRGSTSNLVSIGPILSKKMSFENVDDEDNVDDEEANNG